MVPRRQRLQLEILYFGDDSPFDWSSYISDGIGNSGRDASWDITSTVDEALQSATGNGGDPPTTEEVEDGRQA